MSEADERRIAELEDALKIKTDKVAELRATLDEQNELIGRLRESAEDYNNCIESWCEGFQMEMVEGGAWSWKPFWEEWQTFHAEHSKLIKEHNKLCDYYDALVERWNAKVRGGRPVGRPLAASEAQCATVIKLYGAGASLSEIAEETSLGVNTIRTVVGKASGNDRTTQKYRRRNSAHEVERSKSKPVPAPDARKKANRRKQQIRTINALPQRAQRVVEEGRALVREAKGLGRS